MLPRLMQFACRCLAQSGFMNYEVLRYGALSGNVHPCAHCQVLLLAFGWRSFAQPWLAGARTLPVSSSSASCSWQHSLTSTESNGAGLAADLLEAVSASLEDELSGEFAKLGPWFVGGRCVTLLGQMATAAHLAPKKSQMPDLWLGLAPGLLETLPALMQDSRLASQCAGESASPSCHLPLIFPVSSLRQLHNVLPVACPFLTSSLQPAISCCWVWTRPSKALLSAEMDHRTLLAAAADALYFTLLLPKVAKEGLGAGLWQSLGFPTCDPPP